MQRVPPVAVAAWFAPERPGPLVHAHVAATGIGRCRVDRWPEPRTVLAELPGNVACRGEPSTVADLVGFVEAPPDWLPALRGVDPRTRVWQRVIAELPDGAEVPRPQEDVRRLGSGDAWALARLHPSIL